MRLRFSRAVESELTTITLFRGGAQVAGGGARVQGGEGREFLLALPAPLEAGEYEARWKTVGSDGHVLEGSWRFTVAAASAVAPAPTAAAVAAAGVDDPPPTPTTDGTDDALEEEVGAAGRPLAVAVRWAWFAALLGMIGAIAFRYGVLPRLDRDPLLRPVAARAEAAVWFVALGAAALGADYTLNETDSASLSARHDERRSRPLLDTLNMARTGAGETIYHRISYGPNEQSDDSASLAYTHQGRGTALKATVQRSRTTGLVDKSYEDVFVAPLRAPGYGRGATRSARRLSKERTQVTMPRVRSTWSSGVATAARARGSGLKRSVSTPAIEASRVSPPPLKPASPLQHRPCPR